MATKTAPKTAPKTRRASVAGTAKNRAAKSERAAKARAAAAPKTVASAPRVSGPKAETLAFAAKVVKLRDVDGLSWAEVAEALGVAYDTGYSSRLRRAYVVGNGETNGVQKAKREAAKAAREAEAAKASRRTARRTRAAK